MYSGIQFVGMGLFGTETWSPRGDAFAVYFGFLARLSPWEHNGREIRLRRPLSGLPRWPLLPGSVAALAVAIGIVTFDGSTGGPLWQSIADTLVDFYNALGLELQPLELPYATGMLACILLVGAFYALRTYGARSSGAGATPPAS